MAITLRPTDTLAKSSARTDVAERQAARREAASVGASSVSSFAASPAANPAMAPAVPLSAEEAAAFAMPVELWGQGAGGGGLYDRAKDFVARNPTRDGGTWDQWCGSLMVRFGDLPTSRPSAIEAAHASNIVSGDASAAPPGAFHFWDIGQYGHVGVDLNGGGSSVFMASRKLSEAWGDAIGVNSVGGYNAASGARYMGWSMDYAGSRMPGAGQPGRPAPAPSNGPVPRTSTQEDGVPGSIFYKRLQLFARSHGYTGPIDGVMGKNSWAGVQRGLQASAGYTGPADGVPGPNTYKAMQTLASRNGYNGPIDGALGPNSYRGLAAFLNANV